MSMRATGLSMGSFYLLHSTHSSEGGMVLIGPAAWSEEIVPICITGPQPYYSINRPNNQTQSPQWSA